MRQVIEWATRNITVSSHNRQVITTLCEAFLKGQEEFDALISQFEGDTSLTPDEKGRILSDLLIFASTHVSWDYENNPFGLPDWFVSREKIDSLIPEDVGARERSRAFLHWMEVIAETIEQDGSVFEQSVNALDHGIIHYVSPLGETETRMFFQNLVRWLEHGKLLSQEKAGRLFGFAFVNQHSLTMTEGAVEQFAQALEITVMRWRENPEAMICACESAVFLQEFRSVADTTKMLYHRLAHEPCPAEELRITLRDMGLLNG